MEYEPVLTYIREYWPRIVRFQPRGTTTSIGLPHPYLVPSDTPMFQEMYYWDSYFMALGLIGTEYEHLIVGMAENMAALLRRFAIIPNGSRYYFLSRSQPPFSTAMIWLAYGVTEKKDAAEARRFLARVMRLAAIEHELVWMGTAQPNFRQVYAGLSRYFDANFLDALASCESGWDHTTRCDERWLQHLPVDLNAILYARELDLARAAELLGRDRRARDWLERARVRAEAMHELMWDEAEGFYFDYDFANKRRNPTPSLAGFYPLWAGLATRDDAARMVDGWLPRFEFPGGLVTTLDAAPGKQWAYPNGWAPLQWLVTSGLERYGFTEEAQRIRRKWLDTCAAVFAATGQMWEKYNVVEVGAKPEPGLYGDVPGFGWTNAVFADFVTRITAPQ